MSSTNYKFSDTLYDRRFAYTGINQVDLLRYMAKPNVTNDGVIFNIDITGQVGASTVGKMGLTLKMLIGSDIYNNKITIHGCQTGDARTCKNYADYTLLIGRFEIDKLNKVKAFSLEIKKVDVDTATIKFNTDAVNLIKY